MLSNVPQDHLVRKVDQAMDFDFIYDAVILIHR
jgi:hypothetical protein